MKRKRSPIKWPDGARIAITPCVAFETWPEELGAPGSLQQENRRPQPTNAVTKKNLATITDREFGERVGVFRMLEIFQKEGIQTTFFPTGITVENYPDVFKEIVAQGHEIGTETWIHDYSYMKKRDKEKKDLQKTVKIVQETVGKPPKGYLSTGVSPSADTPEIITELGYTYWMDPQHEETPYTLKIKGTELTVLSYFQDLNDYSTFQRAGRTPRELLQQWKACFDCLYEEGAKDPKFRDSADQPPAARDRQGSFCPRQEALGTEGHSKVWF